MSRILIALGTVLFVGSLLGGFIAGVVWSLPSEFTRWFGDGAVAGIVLLLVGALWSVVSTYQKNRKIDTSLVVLIVIILTFLFFTSRLIGNGGF